MPALFGGVQLVNTMLDIDGLEVNEYSIVTMKLLMQGESPRDALEQLEDERESLESLISDDA